MDIFDLFQKEGMIIDNKEDMVHLLHDPEYAWLVLEGKALFFLSALRSDNETGVRYFWFEAGPGELLYGMECEMAEHGMVIQAAPSLDCVLIRVETVWLAGVSEEKVKEKLSQMTQNWLKHISEGLRGAADNEMAAAEEGINIEEFIKEKEIRSSLHSRILSSQTERCRKQRENEEIQRKRRQENDQRLMSSSLKQLTALNQKEKKTVLYEDSGNALADVCNLIGQSLKMKVVLPSQKEEELTLNAIARASHFRTREISLNGKWYRQDGGPILGYLKEDGRPVALLPRTPSSYILYDPTNGYQCPVNKKVASQIREEGVVLFRPFEQKKIGLKELMIFGVQSCWKQDLFRIAIMGAFGGILGTAVPLATGLVFDYVIPEGDIGALLQIGLILCVSALATMLFQLTRALATQRMEGKMDGALQAAVWDRLLSLPVPFFKQYSSGDLAMRAMGISQIRMILSGTTLNSILSGIFSVFTFVVLFYYNSRLAMVAALLVLLSILVMALLAARKVKYEHKVLAASNRITGLLVQLIGSVTKLKIAGAQSRAFSRWANEFKEQCRLTLCRERISNVLAVFYTAFPVLAGMIIFYIQASGEASMSASRFIGFYSAFVSFMLSLVGLANSIIGANLVIPLYKRAKPILETLPEDDDNKLSPGTLTGEIEVSHVSFRYQSDGPLVLQDVSFRIEEGDYVALVGTSGCGKSTLLRILLGFETPETGNIYYNGQDLSKVDVRAVRRQLGVVLQNGQLMTGSIFNNIVGTNPYLSMDDAWEAAAMAGIEEDIKEMPMGMHTTISEGASTISGGQKQRIMIARAIVNKPRIIYFDEATSALDNTTQAIVSSSLDNLKSTRIVIAHRLSTIRNCNKILVMDQGRIVEQGTYQELMERDGVFASLARRQMV
jgi:NHLM bacteriocin system ABC transporter ATP-binding protein